MMSRNESLLDLDTYAGAQRSFLLGRQSQFGWSLCNAAEKKTRQYCGTIKSSCENHLLVTADMPVNRLIAGEVKGDQ